MDLADVILLAALAGGAGIFSQVSTHLAPSYTMTRGPSTADWRAGDAGTARGRSPAYFLFEARGGNMDFASDENDVMDWLAAGTSPDQGITLADFY